MYNVYIYVCAYYIQRILYNNRMRTEPIEFTIVRAIYPRDLGIDTVYIVRGKFFIKLTFYAKFTLYIFLEYGKMPHTLLQCIECM